MKRCVLQAITVIVILMGFAIQPVSAQYPTKPLELVVPFSAGQAPDTVARELARGMTKHLGQQVVVMNKPGGGGALGYEYTQSRKPDGYTFALSSNSISTTYYSGLSPYTYKSFDPVARVSLELPVLAVHKDSPLNNLKDLVSFVKQNPGKMSVGSTSIGSHMHLTLVGFFSANDLNVTTVPFPKGGHVTSLLGKEIDALVTLPGSLAAQVHAGKLKVLGVLASTREPVFADVPTATEQGFPFQADLWRGIHLPKGTPPEIIARLEKAIQESVLSAEFKKLGETVGYIPAYQNSEAFAKMVAADDVVVAQMMTKAGLRKK
jgi:tripartite-type tricarboxylate transporter receptor subunit TctC